VCSYQPEQWEHSFRFQIDFTCCLEAAGQKQQGSNLVAPNGVSLHPHASAFISARLFGSRKQGDSFKNHQSEQAG
jgi:hypothetical protein